jgi:hypothetical protein
MARRNDYNILLPGLGSVKMKENYIVVCSLTGYDSAPLGHPPCFFSQTINGSSGSAMYQHLISAVVSAQLKLCNLRKSWRGSFTHR